MSGFASWRRWNALNTGFRWNPKKTAEKSVFMKSVFIKSVCKKVFLKKLFSKKLLRNRFQRAIVVFVQLLCDGQIPESFRVYFVRTAIRRVFFEIRKSYQTFVFVFVIAEQSTSAKHILEKVGVDYRKQAGPDYHFLEINNNNNKKITFAWYFHEIKKTLFTHVASL